MFIMCSAQESPNPGKLRRNASASANIDSLGSTIAPTKSGLSSKNLRNNVVGKII